jgi:hypothetical protein
VARRKQSEAQVSERDDKALERRLRNLLRGATAWGLLDDDDPRASAESAAREAIADGDDERLDLPTRVAAREDLLAEMGRLDRAVRHVAHMERVREQWASAWGKG